MTTTITQVGGASAGDASLIALQALNENEGLTAIRNGSGELMLIGWHTPAGGPIRRAKGVGKAGKVGGIALNLLGDRRVVTSVRTAEGTLRLISWAVAPDLESIERLGDSALEAGAASLIEATVTTDPTTLVTAVRAGNGNLLLISWRLEADGSFTRLGDSGSQAGQVGLIAVSALGSPSRIVVTAVRTASGTLKMIGWTVPSQGPIVRIPRDFEAGAVGEIAMARRRDTPDGIFFPSGVVTAVRNGSGNLQVTLWDVGATGIGRGAEVTAGKARALAIAGAGPSRNSYVATMRNGSGFVQLIAFEVGRNGSLTRTGEKENKNVDVTETAIVGLSDGRALTSTRDRHFLSVETWNIAEQIPMSPQADENVQVSG